MRADGDIVVLAAAAKGRRGAGVGAFDGLGREPINLPGGRLAEVRYAPIATDTRLRTGCRDGPTADISVKVDMPAPNSAADDIDHSAINAATVAKAV
jgi:hypothetical protein